MTLGKAQVEKTRVAGARAGVVAIGTRAQGWCWRH